MYEINILSLGVQLETKWTKLFHVKLEEMNIPNTTYNSLISYMLPTVQNISSYQFKFRVFNDD